MYKQQRQEVSSFLRKFNFPKFECSLIRRELKKNRSRNLFMQLTSQSLLVEIFIDPSAFFQIASDGWIADTAREAKRN